MEYRNIMRGVSFACFLALAACGGGGGGGGGGDSDRDAEPVVEQRSAITLSLATISASELPDGATIQVRATGHGIAHTATLADGDTVAQFNSLLVGEYVVEVTVESGGTEIGSYQETIALSAAGASVEANIVYNKADLVVEPLVGPDYSVLNGTYDGNIGGNGCIDLPFGTTPTNAVINIVDNTIGITLELFPDPNMILTGTLNDSSGELVASGTYQSSDFTSGTWTSGSIRMPTAHSTFFVLNLVNQTSGDCVIYMEFAGFKGFSGIL